MKRRVAIIGGGISGITAAYELARLARDGAPVEATLFEASPRFGGIVETVREGGFIIDCGPDGWVTEKPWARQLAEELGLADQLIPSNDATRRTYILKGGSLQPIPDGLRMMVPTDLAALDNSPLFSETAKKAYRDEPESAEELKATAPTQDESVASFVRRHFGEEVLDTLAAPLLSGVFGGDVATLSVRAVMPSFIAMEKEHGSLIKALQTRTQPHDIRPPAIFTTLRNGVATLIESMVATIPPTWLRPNSKISSLNPSSTGWTLAASVESSSLQKIVASPFDAVFIAAPIDTARSLIAPSNLQAAELMEVDSSSAVIVAFAFPAADLPIPLGFGFLVPPVPSLAPNISRLLACTFTDQKFNHRAPHNGRLIRLFFGGPVAERMMSSTNDEIASIARLEVARILGPLPDPAITVVRRWPRSLPQYAVGHLDRMAALNTCIAQMPGLSLLGNGYRGVGLPDLIRDARTEAQKVGQA